MLINNIAIAEGTPLTGFKTLSGVRYVRVLQAHYQGISLTFP